jgi:hypothetical protein
MTIPGKLTVDKTTGHLTGPVKIEYNDPWPCVNGTPHVTGAMNGVVMHTMVGNLPGTIAVFNKPGFGASAHFGIAQDGTVHQFGPIGKGWEAWHAFAANKAWYGIEHADNGDPNQPLTDAQIAASAQILECLSSFAGFKLQVTDDKDIQGYAYHSMEATWNLNHHTCPDIPPKHVRSSQRAAVVDLARKIRAAAVTPQPFPSGQHVVGDNPGTLAALAKLQGCDVADIWFATAENRIGNGATGNVGFGPLQRAYLNAGNWDARMPSGMVLFLP